MKISLEKIEAITKEFDTEQMEVISGIADSLKEVGLSHPVILRKGSPNERFRIVSGERRIAAARLLKWKEIDAEIREIDEQQGKLIRIHENLKRHNLPWPEQVQLVEELHAQRQAIHGISPRGRPSLVDRALNNGEKRGWSLRDTAEELQVGLGTLSEDLLLSRALNNDRNLAKVKDKKTALRLARIAINREQAEIDSEAPGINTGLALDEIYLGDSAEILQRLPDMSVDHCITDPPWIKFYDEKLRIDDRTLPVFKELYRVLKPGALTYMFCGLADVHYYCGFEKVDATTNQIVHNPGRLEHIGFKIAATPIIWRKEKSLSYRGRRAWEYDRDFEFIIVAAKGDPVLTTSGKMSAIKSFPIVPSASMKHPNEKPVDLILDIMQDCSYPGNVIIDPFSGSGVVGIAAIKMKRHFILVERDPTFYNKIVARVNRFKGANGDKSE
jgi:DNA modification methylase